MKSFQVQTHYELLEISVSASTLEVRGAFERLTRLFDDDQVALYGLVDADRAAALRARLAVALETLCDDDARAAYDATLGLPPREPVQQRSAPQPLNVGDPMTPRWPQPEPVPLRPAPMAFTMVDQGRVEAPSGSSTFGWGGGYSYVTAPAPSAPVAQVVALETPAAGSPQPELALGAPHGDLPVQLERSREAEASLGAPASAPVAAAVSVVPVVEAQPVAASVGVREVDSAEQRPVAPILLLELSAPSGGTAPDLDEDPLAIVPARATPSRDFRVEKVTPFEVPAGVEINGDLLRQVRMARGLSMMQLAERTRIGVRGTSRTSRPTATTRFPRRSICVAS
jgi:hypothetical protein